MKKIHFASALMMAAVSGSLFAQTLVTVNGQAIDSSVIDNQVKNIRAANSQIQDSPALRQELTNNQIVATVISQEAKRLKLDQSAEYKQAVEQARAAAKQSGEDKKAGFKADWAAFETNLLGQAYLMHTVRQNPVQEADVKAAYDQFSKRYKGTQEVQLGEILTRSSADAEKAIADLKAKKSFSSVLQQYSMDERAKQTGGISANYIPLKDLEQNMPQVYAAVKDLKKGGYTAKPLFDGNVYGVFYINDRRSIKVPTYDQTKNNIAGDLQEARVDAAIRSLMQKADIKPAK
ncbi:peptidylprolyl isomerase [Bergeriella denitrificans]|uniref:peptidylprolyl isomerase n=1 Tax=Bergeriella denitrificans TaxID=494 RepID=A0A378UFQ6_BERDE|nr:peptidyl-prolyl cis-trans isomerase [Bergeriella denitrificans]STZ75331.1 Cell-binding factor, putative [Bergeriella denitrificans]